VRTQGGSTTVYLPGGQEVTVDGDGHVTVQRTYTFAGQAVAVRTGATHADVFTQVTDPHSTATIAINNAATSQVPPVRRYLDPYGNPRGNTTTTEWPTDRGLLNKPVDDTGLALFGARYYDASLGAFISVDPVMDLADPDQWNPYAYATNNPVTNTDPTGMLYEVRIDDSYTDMNGNAHSGSQTLTVFQDKKYGCFRPRGERAIDKVYEQLSKWTASEGDSPFRKIVNENRERLDAMAMYGVAAAKLNPGAMVSFTSISPFSRVFR
jgi:RHS repeat-associated protein